MAPGVSTCYYREVSPSISFSGSGFMATYQLGVSQCFHDYAPWLLRTAPCVLGASAGSLVAAAVVCEMNLITLRDEMIHFAKQMKTFTLGPFNPSVNVFHWLELILRKYLPANAHQLASGRLAVAVTRMADGKPMIMSEFQSKEDVVQALLCSCFVPGYCGMLPPTFNGVHYVDGGFSSMQPVLPVPCSHMLTVSPFSGDTDICPLDTPSMWKMVVSGCTLNCSKANSLRTINALYPMTLESLEDAYQRGYKDAIHFLMCNNFGPYHTIHGLLDFNQAKVRINPETDIKEEGEMKVEKKKTAPLTSFTHNKCMQTGSSAEHERSGNQPMKEPLLHFDLIKNVLLCNVVTYLSMFGLPARILSHLLVPLMLFFYIVKQSGHRLELLFRQVPEMMGWTWYCLRHFTVFFYSAFVNSLDKNVRDRVVPIMLLLEWLKIHVKNEAPRGQRQSTLCY